MTISPGSSSNASSDPQQARRVGMRIAQRLFLSYVLPLAVLLVAGLALPFVLWSYLGGFVEDYNARVQFADRAQAWRRMALETEAQARAYVLLPDPTFDQQFMETRVGFSAQYRSLSEYLDAHGNTALRTALQNANQSYKTWVNTSIRPYRAVPEPRRRNEANAVGVTRIRVGFVRVRADLDTFVLAANDYRNREQERSQGFDVMRRIVSVAIPITAIILAMLIGRSIALGITRPLESLTRATEALEAGNAPPLLLPERREMDSGPAGDEISELQEAFGRMARTIRQREAVLRAQNDALGALNRRVEALLNATNDGVVMLDRAGGFSVVNQRFAILFGVEADTLQDHTFERAGSLMLSRFKNKTQARERFEEILADPESIIDEIFELIEPVNRTLRIYSAPVRGDEHIQSGENATKHDELLGRIFVFRDVTRETVVDRMKTEFVSTVSHELRTPLTAIKGYVDLMVGGQTGPMNEVQTEFLTMVQASTRRLTALINDMLDISRIESGRMEIRYESVAYLPLVWETVRMMQNEASARQITLTAELENSQEEVQFFPRVSGDADRITQVLINFISNGIKYTTQGGRVTVRVGRDGDVVTTCVEDNGIGISPEDQRRLFQKFFRADNSTTREVGGTGLGLAITKAILEKLNGTVWVDSKPGQGSRFWFTLPTVVTDDEVTKHASGSAAPTLPQLVLCVDDDPEALHRFSTELRRQGITPATATSPAEALRRARDLRPDLILLNPLTTAFDAIDLLRKLRARKDVDVTLIALTDASLGDDAPKRGTVHLISRFDLDAILTEVFSEVAGATPEPGMATLTAVIASETTTSHIRTLAQKAGMHLIAGHTMEEIEADLAGQPPAVLVVDTSIISTNTIGVWASQMRRTYPNTKFPSFY